MVTRKPLKEYTKEELIELCIAYLQDISLLRDIIKEHDITFSITTEDYHKRYTIDE